MRVCSLGTFSAYSMSKNKKPSTVKPSFGADVRIVPQQLFMNDKTAYSERVINFLTQAPQKYKDLGTDNDTFLLNYKKDSHGPVIEVTFFKKDAQKARQEFIDEFGSLYEEAKKVPNKSEFGYEICGVVEGSPEYNKKFKRVDTQETRSVSYYKSNRMPDPIGEVLDEADEIINYLVKNHKIPQKFYNSDCDFLCCDTKHDTNYKYFSADYEP